MNHEFYIGWEPKAAPGITKMGRKVVIALFSMTVIASLGLAAAQRMIDQSVFEWGIKKSFSGILQTDPYPSLFVPRPGIVGKTNNAPQFSTYYLVAPWKFGLNLDSLAPLSGKSVTLKGTLIYRGNQTMIETKPEWIRANDNSSKVPLPEAIRVGRQTLVGEIVDSKCFLGVMNPGQLAPHRACAIRCISGGIPPVLVVGQKSGPATFLLLVSSEGKPVNKNVLDIVAEPVEITGVVQRQGDLLFLRADPTSYRRLK